MEEVAGDDFLPDRETIRSVGTGSPQWMRHTFSRPEAQDSAYVTANPFSHWFVDKADVGRFDPVYADCWSDDEGTVLPTPVTDRAIATWRRCQPGRMIVHYMQPHYPFVPDTLGDIYDGVGTIPDRPVWARLGDGELSRERVWRAYRSNLECALQSVGLLLRTVDADVVITSDHGNALGERGIYGHANGLPIPALVEVPWIETTAERVRAYEPDEAHLQPGFEDATPGVEVGKTGVQNRLEALGYR